MRGGLSAVVAALAVLGSSSIASSTVSVGEPEPLTRRAFEQRMKSNPELEAYVAMRGYPDWVEEVEVYSNPPLDAYEVRVYYLRLDREVAFTRAYILGKPDIALRLAERRLTPAMREHIRQEILARSPALRAELAAERAIVAAQSAEEAADSIEATVARVENLAGRMDESFTESLYK